MPEAPDFIPDEDAPDFISDEQVVPHLDASAFRRSDEIPSAQPASGAPGGPPANPMAMALPISIGYGLGPGGASSLVGLAKEALKGVAKAGIGAAGGAELGSLSDRLGLTGGYGVPTGAIIGGALGGFKGGAVADAAAELPYGGRMTAPIRMVGRLLRDNKVSAENVALAEKLVAKGVFGDKAEALDMLSKATPDNVKTFQALANRSETSSVPPYVPNKSPEAMKQIDDAVAASKARMSPPVPIEQTPEGAARLAARQARGEANVAASQALQREPPVIEPAGGKTGINELAREAARQRVAEEEAAKVMKEAAASRKAAEAASDSPIEKPAKLELVAKKALAPSSDAEDIAGQIEKKVAYLNQKTGSSRYRMAKAIQEQFGLKLSEAQQMVAEIADKYPRPEVIKP